MEIQYGLSRHPSMGNYIVSKSNPGLRTHVLIKGYALLALSGHFISEYFIFKEKSYDYKNKVELTPKESKTNSPQRPPWVNELNRRKPEAINH
ncbi:MAG: hypothetical protein R3220_09050, partial [Balneolaceae bacterium]|nr:hypothetical protein [Balneolaceae bacterium]